MDKYLLLASTSHESILAAGERRLQEELGITAPLKDLGWFHYNAHFPNGLSENEIDHVLIGQITDTQKTQPNLEEVHATRWITLAALSDELEQYPEQFTPWLLPALNVFRNSFL